LQLDQVVQGESGTDSKNDIAGRRKQITIKPENLPYQPFDSVAPYCITNLSVHTNSQPLTTLSVRQKNHGKPVTMKSLPKSINALKLLGCLEQVNFRKSETVQRAQADSCFRPFALLLLITA
jgi:hypothetical protein